MPFLKTFFTNPFALIGLAALVTLAAFRVPEFADYLFGGALITVTQSFVAVAILLGGVWVSRKARAAFPKGDFDDLTLAKAVLVLGAYVSCALVIAAVILSH